MKKFIAITLLLICMSCSLSAEDVAVYEEETNTETQQAQETSN